MANRLGAATSPYLLQHKDKPVHWWEWGQDAFVEARRVDRQLPPTLRGFRRAARATRHEDSDLEDADNGGKASKFGFVLLDARPLTTTAHGSR